MAVLAAARVVPGVSCMRGMVWLTGVMTAAVRRPMGHGLPGGGWRLHGRLLCVRGHAGGEG